MLCMVLHVAECHGAHLSSAFSNQLSRPVMFRTMACIGWIRFFWNKNDLAYITK
jgi:hypothetical protein